MKETAFNMSGFIQPSFVEKKLLSDDADGFNDRQFFVFPPNQSHNVAIKAVFSQHGIPEILRSDNGPQYASQEFKEFHWARPWFTRTRVPTHSL